MNPGDLDQYTKQTLRRFEDQLGEVDSQTLNDYAEKMIRIHAFRTHQSGVELASSDLGISSDVESHGGEVKEMFKRVQTGMVQVEKDKKKKHEIGF